jgi:hypothetical protein
LLENIPTVRLRRVIFFSISTIFITACGHDSENYPYPTLDKDIVIKTAADIKYLTPKNSPDNIYDIQLNDDDFFSTESHQAILRFKDNGDNVLKHDELKGAVIIIKYRISPFTKKKYLERANEFFNIGGDQIIKDHTKLINSMDPFNYNNKEEALSETAERLIGIETIMNNPVLSRERRIPTDQELMNKMKKGTELLERIFFQGEVKFTIPKADKHDYGC